MWIYRGIQLGGRRSLWTSPLNLHQQKEQVARGLPKKIPIPGVKHVILVSSAKGGVGKSATSVNLGITLRSLEPEKTVGILDADIYGPSIPMLMKLQHEEPPLLNPQNLMIPPVNYGIKVMSMGFLVRPEDAIVWRGLMVMQAIERLIRKVVWGPLDYLVVDLPPGTGDVHLSLTQNIPVSGAVIVTTGESISLNDARRGLKMWNQVGVTVFGAVENMASIMCPKCGNSHPLFGRKDVADALQTKVIGRIPHHHLIGDGGETGIPFMLQSNLDDSGLIVKDSYLNLGRNVISQLPSPLTQ